MHGYRLQRPFRCCLPASALTVLSLLPSILQSLLIPSFTTSTTANLLLPPLQRSPSPASCDQWHPLRHQYTSHSTSNRLPPGCPSAQQPVLRALVVHPTALLLRMTPTLQPPLEPITSASPGPTTFVTLMAGTNPNTASSVFTSSAPCHPPPSWLGADRPHSPTESATNGPRLLAPVPVTVRVPRTIVHLRPCVVTTRLTSSAVHIPPFVATTRPTPSAWSASRLSSRTRNSELIAAAAATA